MSFKLELVIWLSVLVTLAYMKGRTYVRTVDDVMAIKPNFLTSMGYHIFLSMVLCAHAHAKNGAPLLLTRISFLHEIQILLMIHTVALTWIP